MNKKKLEILSSHYKRTERVRAEGVCEERQKEIWGGKEEKTMWRSYVKEFKSFILYFSEIM